MANRNKIATQIAKGLPGGFIAFKGMAYRPQFSFVARGILIEGTPDKDTNYVWHLSELELEPPHHQRTRAPPELLSRQRAGDQ